MRRFLVPGIVLIALLLLGGGVLYVNQASIASSAVASSTDASVQPVNAVLGNESFTFTFGVPPTAHTSEMLRLKTHLAYVEGLLRARDVSHLLPRQRERRLRLLDELHAYWKAGVFPRNTYRPGRTPVFIDEEGRLCAAGYLIAQSAGRKVAERIDERYHLAYISEIDAPVLDTWAEKHGFTRRELAMIQPTYCQTHPNDPRCRPDDESEEKMSKSVEIAGMGVNASAALLNGLLVGYSRRSRLAAGAGLVSGGVGLALGLSGEANYPAADIALAGASILLSGWQLLRDDTETAAPDHKPAAALKVSPAVLPDGTGGRTMGLHVRWRF